MTPEVKGLLWTVRLALQPAKNCLARFLCTARLWDNPTEVHMRTVCWGQVSDNSQQPESWNEVDVDDTADKAEVRRQVVHDGSFADPPELRLLSKGGAWRKWENCQTLPPGDLKVKVVSRKPGQFDAHILAICQLAS